MIPFGLFTRVILDSGIVRVDFNNVTWVDNGDGTWSYTIPRNVHLSGVYPKTHVVDKSNNLLNMVSIQFNNNAIILTSLVPFSDFVCYFMGDNNETSADYIPPIHYWPLTSNTNNIGSSPDKPSLDIPVQFYNVNGHNMAGVTSSTNHPIGFSLTMPSAYTVIYALVPSADSTFNGLLCDVSGSVEGTTQLYVNGNVKVRDATLFGNGHRWDNPDVDAYGKVGEYGIYVMTKTSDNLYMAWVNGVKVWERSPEKTLTPVPITHFGRFNSVFLPTSFRFGDIEIYDYVLTPDQINRHYRGEWH